MLKRIMEVVEGIKLKRKVKQLRRRVEIITEIANESLKETKVLASSIELEEDLFNIGKGKQIDITESRFYGNDEEINKYMTRSIFSIECNKNGVCLNKLVNFVRESDCVKYNILKFEIKPGLL